MLDNVANGNYNNTNGKILLAVRRCNKMMQSNETTRMVELLTTATKLPEPMQALALGYAKGLADAEKLRAQPADPKKSA